MSNTIKAPALRVITAMLITAANKLREDYYEYRQQMRATYDERIEDIKAVESAEDIAAILSVPLKRRYKDPTEKDASPRYSDEVKAKRLRVEKKYSEQRKEMQDYWNWTEVRFNALNCRVELPPNNKAVIEKWQKLATDTDNAFIDGDAKSLVEIIRKALGG